MYEDTLIHIIGFVTLVVVVVGLIVAIGHFSNTAQAEADVRNRPCIPTCIEAMKAGPLQYESAWANRQGFCTCTGFILSDGGTK